MKYQISNISILQTSKIIAILYAIFGLCLVPFSCALLLPGIDDLETMVLTLFYLLAPILYGILGFVSMAVGSWVYNIVASRLGGVEFDLEKILDLTQTEGSE